MRVQLSAFGGKLTSDIQDWPDNAQIQIPMLVEMPLDFRWEKVNPGMPVKYKRGIFEWRGKTLDEKYPPVRIYELVDLK